MVERRVLLVVDGHPGRRADLARLLLKAPYAIVHAEDSTEATVRLREAKPDLVCVAAEDHAAASQALTLLAEPARDQTVAVRRWQGRSRCLQTRPP